MRKRIFLIIGGTLVVMVVIIIGVTRWVLLEGFARLEARYLKTDLERVSNAIEGSLSSLSRTGEDWAAFDDSYNFMQTRSPVYIAANISDDVFKNLRLNVLLFLDTKGRLVFGRWFDFRADRTGDIPGSLVTWLSTHPDFWRFTTANAHAQGIIRLPEGPLLAVSRPIIRSDRQGPVRGALIMGRSLDKSEAERMADTLRISLTVVTLGSQGTSTKEEKAARALPIGAAPYIDTSNEEMVSAYMTVRDVDGAPAVALRVDEPRDIHQQGELTVRYFIAWILFVGIVFGTVVLVFIETRILSRLFRLSAGVLAVGTGGESLRRVPAEGRDQIAYLGAAINGMLDALGRSTEELRASERRNEAFLDAVPDVIFRVTRDGSILDARSPAKLPLVEAANDLVGRDSEQILALYAFISPEQIDRSLAATKAALDTGTPQSLEFHVDTDGGRRHYEERFVMAGAEEVIVLVRDVTAVKKAEEARDKEVLLKEIHHRVKNNLQVISSLLALQAGSTADAQTRALLNESRDRIRSMALIHEKLYQSEDERGISFSGYVRDLASHLRHSYAGNSDAITVDIDIEDVTLDMDISVPCGLIINELLSNALKYAFPGGRRGTISLRLGRAGTDSFALTISDDGIGLPADIDVRNPASLGLRIVNILVQQLRGTLVVNRGPGTAFTISFHAA